MSDRKLWQKRREFYKEYATVASARADDQVADHICRGLGFPPSAIGKVEGSLGLNLDPELPKIRHARSILNVVSHGLFMADDDEKTGAVLDVRETGDTKKWLEANIAELAEEAEGRSVGVIVCTRGKDPKSLRAIVFTQDTAPMVQPWLLQPGSCLLDRKLGVQVWCRQLTPLVHDMSELLKWQHIGGFDD